MYVAHALWLLARQIRGSIVGMPVKPFLRSILLRSRCTVPTVEPLGTAPIYSGRVGPRPPNHWDPSTGLTRHDTTVEGTAAPVVPQHVHSRGSFHPRALIPQTQSNHGLDP